MKNLTTLRRKLGITQQTLASLCGVSFVSVSRWENGHSMGDLGQVVVELLSSALERHPPKTIIAELRRGDGTLLHAVRTLCRLEDDSVTTLTAER